MSRIAHTARLDICLNPGCEAEPLADMRVPLCTVCARDAAYQYLALAGTSQPEDRAFDATSETAIRPEYRHGHVYFIRLGNRIKIGFTTSLHERLANLPHEEFLGAVPGTMLDERRCQAAFKSHRLVGEWFADHEDIRQFIASVTSAA